MAKELSRDDLVTLRTQMHNIWHSKTADTRQRSLAHLVFQQCDNLINERGGPALRELMMASLREVYDAFGGTN